MYRSESPAVSVVVPFLNSERHLAVCIESLLSQVEVEGGSEIILVDNGSTDRSPAIVRRYPKVILLEEHAAGAYAARNTGVRRARAPLIGFTDADCVVAPDWLQSIQSGMADPSVAVLLGYCSYPESASRSLRLLEAYENSKAHYVIHSCAPAYRFGYANNMAVRASLFAECGPFKEWRRAADTELVQRLAQMRPDLRSRYLPSMRVTHMEFVRTRDRLGRMRLYSQTNAKIDTFRELGLPKRFGVVWQMLRDLRLNP